MEWRCGAECLMDGRRGGEGGIRTRGAFAHRFSRAAPSTTRTPLRRRGYQRGLETLRPWLPRRGCEELLRLVAPDAADDPDSAREIRVLSQLDDGPCGAIRPV